VTIFGLVSAYVLAPLGLWPFVASWLYVSHARKQRASPAGVIAFILIPAALQLATIGIVRWGVSHVEQRGGPPVLPAMRPFYDADELVDRYLRLESSPEEKRLVNLAYVVMTGHDISLDTD